jgi:hypothetical protein
MSDNYACMNVYTLQLRWAQKKQELAQAESEGASRQALISIYRELKSIQYYLSMAFVSSEAVPA